MADKSVCPTNGKGIYPHPFPPHPFPPRPFPPYPFPPLSYLLNTGTPEKGQV